MFSYCRDTSGLINDRVQLKIKCSFLYFLILWRPLVSIVCIHPYINRWSRHKKLLSHRRGSATENQWLATNFGGDHLLLTCGHSHYLWLPQVALCECTYNQDATSSESGELVFASLYAHCTQLQQESTKWALYCYVKLSANKALE